MAVSMCIRPRSAIERRALSKLLLQAPKRVGIGFADDGWVAASLRIAGREPVWASRADASRAERFLRRVGLPGLGVGEVGGIIDEQLELRAWAPAGVLPMPATDGPLVSVVICTYQRRAMLAQTLDSVRAQSWPVEIIVVSDGCTDGTNAWLQSQPDVRAICLERNRGKSTALAVGIAAASGELVLVLDDDDLLLPGAVQVLASSLLQDPDRIGVFGDAVLFRDHDVHSYRPALRSPGATMRRAVLSQVPGLTGALMVRTDTLRMAGDFDTRLARGEDMDMFLRLSRLGTLSAVPLPTFLCRVHDGLRAGRWRKTDAQAYEAETLDCIRPVFMERWRALAPYADRAEGHAWALGLKTRGLPDEANAELSRWTGPYTASEAWVRAQCGLESTLIEPEHTLVVVDEGDPGALEACLEQNAARESALWIDLEVPRDPLGDIRLHWQGEYAARARLQDWVVATGPVHLRLSSSPEWAPPAVADLADLPKLPAAQAVHALAAANGWSRPSESRCGVSANTPLVQALWAGREALDAGEHAQAVRALAPALEVLRDWRPAWGMIAEALRGLGKVREAQACQARAA